MTKSQDRRDEGTVNNPPDVEPTILTKVHRTEAMDNNMDSKVKTQAAKLSAHRAKVGKVADRVAANRGEEGKDEASRIDV